MLPRPSVKILALSGEELLTTPIQPETTVKDLKEMLQQREQVPRFRQRLLRRQQNMPDERTLQDTTELQLVQLSYIAATETQLHSFGRAAAAGDLRAVEEILQRPQNPNDTFQTGEHLAGGHRPSSPLTLAATYNRVDVMRLLLSAKADITLPGNSDALEQAAEEGHTAAIRVLLEARAEAHLRQDSIALHVAAEGNHAETLEVLLAARADPQGVQPSWTYGPLGLACHYGNIEATRVLLFHQANPLARERNGLSPLDLAAEQHHRRIEDIITEHVLQQRESNQSRTRASAAAPQ